MLGLFRGRNREELLVLEVFSDTLRETALELSEKQFTLLGQKTVPSFDALKKERKLRQFKQPGHRRRVLVSVAPELVAVLLIPLIFKREAQDVPIKDLELENMLGERLGVVFNQCREKASRTLRINQSETVLIDSRVGNFRVDGHSVIDPVGFRGRRFEALIELTFIGRSLYDEVSFFFKDQGGFFFTERSRAGLFALSRMFELPVSLAFVGEETTAVFTLKQAAYGPAIFHSMIPWGSSRFLEVLGSLWAMSRRATELVYDAYCGGELSSDIERMLQSIFRDSIEAFFKRAEGVQKEGLFFITSARTLPSPFPRRSNKLTIDLVPTALTVRKAGFEWNGAPPPLEEQLFIPFATFLESYYDNRSETAISRWLRRRLHWLGAISYHRT